MNWKVELFIILYFFIGFLINVWYYERYKNEFYILAKDKNKLAINFVVTWIIWLPLYAWYLFRYIVWWIVSK